MANVQKLLDELGEMAKPKGFIQQIRESFGEREQETHWYYIAFQTDRDKARKTGKISFLGAAVLQSISEYDVVRDAHMRKIAPEDSETRDRPLEIPADKLPAEEYRNRLLSREEIEKLWPEVPGK